MASKYRFCLVPAFTMPSGGRFSGQEVKGLPKEQRLLNYNNVKYLLADVDWDLHDGAIATYGDWPVETWEEFMYAGAARLSIINEVCKSGKYNAIVLLGGGEPGAMEAAEIARKYRIPVTSNASAQMHIACMLGNKFSVLDISELHNMYYYHLVIRNGFKDRCASIRNLNYPLPRPGNEKGTEFSQEKQKAMAGEYSEAVARAISEAEVAIQEDGAEVITFGCAATFWLQPFVLQGLHKAGWEVPVLEGYSCSIELAKLLVDLKLFSSGLAFPSDVPGKWRRKKIF